MQKKLTITLDETVYDGLYRVIGRRRISRFIEELVRPYILAQELEAAYQHMAQDETREAEALAWSEATVGDVSDARPVLLVEQCPWANEPLIVRAKRRRPLADDRLVFGGHLLQ